eukprot:1160269-Pelagomonas_calceolata.AAC.15
MGSAWGFVRISVLCVCECVCVCARARVCLLASSVLTGAIHEQQHTLTCSFWHSPPQASTSKSALLASLMLLTTCVPYGTNHQKKAPIRAQWLSPQTRLSLKYCSFCHTSHKHGPH